jgi:hypothetical protein
VDILEGFLQERLHGVPHALATNTSTALAINVEQPLTERSRDEVYSFAKRVCELVMAHADHRSVVGESEDFVDANGGWFPTSVVSRIVPQISRWIAQANEVDRLRFWREQVLQELNVETEELALKALRRLPSRG